MKPEVQERYRQAMLEGGFWEILGQDFEQIKKLVTLSNLVAAHLPAEMVARILEETESARLAIDAQVKRFGFSKSQIDTELLRYLFEESTLIGLSKPKTARPIKKGPTVS